MKKRADFYEKKKLKRNAVSLIRVLLYFLGESIKDFTIHPVMALMHETRGIAYYLYNKILTMIKINV